MLGVSSYFSKLLAPNLPHCGSGEMCNDSSFDVRRARFSFRSSNHVPTARHRSPGGKYEIRQVGYQMFGLGLDDAGPRYANVFHGTISGNTIHGIWADLPAGRTNHTGSIDRALNPITSVERSSLKHKRPPARCRIPKVRLAARKHRLSWATGRRQAMELRSGATGPLLPQVQGDARESSTPMMVFTNLPGPMARRIV